MNDPYKSPYDTGGLWRAVLCFAVLIALNVWCMREAWRSDMSRPTKTRAVVEFIRDFNHDMGIRFDKLTDEVKGEFNEYRETIRQ